MDASVVVAIVSGAGAIFAAVTGFVGSKKSTLHQAEKDFRDTLILENKTLRTRVDELEDELLVSNRRLLKMEAIMIKAGLVMDDDEEAPTPAPV